MAGQKISLLSPVAQVLPTDMFIVARGGGTYKIYGTAFATTPQLEALSKVVSTNSSKAELEALKTSLISVSAGIDTRINTIATTYTSTAYVNNQFDQSKVYVDEQYRTFNNTLSSYITKPGNAQIGNGLRWNGITWIAQDPDPTVVNNYMLDTTSIGGVVWFTATTPPAGYLECNGASLLRSEYPELFAVIGTQWGAVDSLHFNLPDLRSNFIRGWDNNRGIDAGRVFGSYQLDSVGSHTHEITTSVLTYVNTLIDTNVDTDTNLDLDIEVDTDVQTSIEGDITNTIGGNIDTSVFTTITSDATTVVSNTANTTTTVNVSVNTAVEFTANDLTTNIQITATTPAIGEVVYYDIQGGMYELPLGTDFSIKNIDPVETDVTGTATLQANIPLSSTSTAVAETTAVTLVNSEATTTVNSTASSTATSIPNLTATSIFSGVGSSVASSSATAMWQITSTSTAMSLATSTAVSMATSIAGSTGSPETRPSNIALLPCIKYTNFVETTSLKAALSSYVAKPTSATAGQCIGYNGTSWVAVNGLPLTASLNQFLKWNGTSWVAGDYPSNIITHYSTTFVATELRSVVDITGIPSTAKKITIVFSQVDMLGGNVIKLRLGTSLGIFASNYKNNSTAIAPNIGPYFLNNTDCFGLFGSISYTSLTPNSLVPVAGTIVARNVDSTITLTKSQSNTWVFANTGSISEWSVFGGGSVSLPATLDRLSIFLNSGQFTNGSIVMHWE